MMPSKNFHSLIPYINPQKFSFLFFWDILFQNSGPNLMPITHQIQPCFWFIYVTSKSALNNKLLLLWRLRSTSFCDRCSRQNFHPLPNQWLHSGGYWWWRWEVGNWLGTRQIQSPPPRGKSSSRRNSHYYGGSLRLLWVCSWCFRPGCSASTSPCLQLNMGISDCPALCLNSVCLSKTFLFLSIQFCSLANLMWLLISFIWCSNVELQ